MKKILLAGHEGFYNKGCEAIIRSTISLLASVFNNDVKIYIQTNRFAADRKLKLNSPVPVKFFPRHPTNIWKRYSSGWYIRKFFEIKGIHNVEKISDIMTAKNIKGIDIALSVGGDNYSLDYDYPDYYLKLINLLQASKIPHVLWAATVGPFKKEHIEDIRQSLAVFDLLLIRDNLTVQYLEEIGITKNVRLVADPAFLLPMDFSERIAPIVDVMNLRRCIGINLAPIMYKYSHLNKETVKDIFGKFLGHLLNNTDFYVTLIPHVCNGRESNDDFLYMHELLVALGYDNTRIVVLPPDLNFLETKAIISKCEIFIGCRTHSTISAWSSNVPTLNIGYSAKSRAINQDIFGSLDYLLMINDLSLAGLIRKFDNILDNKKHIKETLNRKIPLLQERAKLGARYVKDLMYG